MMETGKLVACLFLFQLHNTTFSVINFLVCPTTCSGPRPSNLSIGQKFLALIASSIPSLPIQKYQAKQLNKGSDAVEQKALHRF